MIITLLIVSVVTIVIIVLFIIASVLSIFLFRGSVIHRTLSTVSKTDMRVSAFTTPSESDHIVPIAVAV
mgnify:CR=1 FL=1